MQFLKNKPKKDTDEALILRFCQENDLEVLGTLYHRYMHLVYGICLKYLKNREESQDAVMQIFEILVKELPRHEIKIFKNWLYGVSKNYCLMKIRKDVSEKKKQENYSSDIFMENTTELHLLDKDEPVDLNIALKECMEALKEQQRLCITSFYYEEKCYQEISDDLNIDLKKVKSFIQNGKRNLKICLDQKKQIDHV
ncbi:RNA polymerase sigma factor [Flavicella sediminum]|uniref:RNA polymerase sigma factor n=1 Tax=Flavicella sediminum TaxID=2585141 RepID=UPI00112383CF|nr:sigma-70 family RNA polymerase sigma factor [Flavicella sediminum]